jgi:uncharacterized damage-inducible protein DinB
VSGEFDADLADIRAALEESRAHLLAVLRSLDDASLDRGRRGGWTVRRVLEHVIQSEHIYARLIQNLRGAQPSQEALPSAPSSVDEAIEQEHAARHALRDAFEGIDEEAFYTLGKIGHEEYSVLSVLENEAAHEREHAAQITSILSS